MGKTAKKPVVIAGTFAQFTAWLRETDTDGDSVIFVSRESDLNGSHGASIIRVGTWHMNTLSQIDRLNGREVVW